jgi:SAM-dependent methyltransferase
MQMSHSEAISSLQATMPDLSNTGERLIPDAEHAAWNYQVHLNRYLYTQKYIKPGWTILDYGCGTGYGLHTLAQSTSALCVGVDKTESIAYAAQRYPAGNIQYQAGDLTDARTRYGPFDLIVSFDVIEHLTDIDAYLQNIAAQLRNDTSLAFISTPWSYRRNNHWPAHNEYHTCELTLTEFFAYLDRYFRIEEITLALGMLAQLRRKGDFQNDLDVLLVPLSGHHLGAIEHDLETMSSTIEGMAVYRAGVAYASQWLMMHQKRQDNLRGYLPHNTQNCSLLMLEQAKQLTASFTAETENLSAIAIPLSTYRRLNGATLEFSLFNEGLLVATVQTPMLLIQDNIAHRFLFPAIPDSMGKTFQLCLQASNACPGHTIGVWCDQLEQPIFQPLYRRYRWHGHPLYSLSVEFIRGDLSSSSPVDQWQAELEAQRQNIDASRAEKKYLPPVHQRPWPADASIWTKWLGALRHYGLVATLGEMISYVRWRFRP